MAGAVALPVNRWLGRGHAAVHRTGIHGGPPTRVAVVALVAAIFGAAVLLGEVIDGGGAAGQGGARIGAGFPGRGHHGRISKHPAEGGSSRLASSGGNLAEPAHGAVRVALVSRS